jgi:hypothetical protein
MRADNYSQLDRATKHTLSDLTGRVEAVILDFALWKSKVDLAVEVL